jgi:hypothetical protein
MLTKNSNMPPFLSFHSLAAARGDGLRPELVDLFKRLAAGTDATLSEAAQPPAGSAAEPVKDGPASEPALSQEGAGRKPSDI